MAQTCCSGSASVRLLPKPKLKPKPKPEPKASAPRFVSPTRLRTGGGRPAAPLLLALGLMLAASVLLSFAHTIALPPSLSSIGGVSLSLIVALACVSAMAVLIVRNAVSRRR